MLLERIFCLGSIPPKKTCLGRHCLLAEKCLKPALLRSKGARRSQEGTEHVSNGFPTDIFAKPASKKCIILILSARLSSCSGRQWGSMPLSLAWASCLAGWCANMPKAAKKRANAPCAVGKPKWISGRQRRISDLGLRCHCVRVWVWGARLAQTANPRRHGANLKSIHGLWKCNRSRSTKILKSTKWRAKGAAMKKIYCWLLQCLNS